MNLSVLLILSMFAISFTSCRTPNTTSEVRDDDLDVATYLYCRDRSGQNWIQLVDQGPNCEAPEGQFCYIGSVSKASNMLNGFDLHDFYTIRSRSNSGGVIQLDLEHSEGEPEQMTAVKCPSSVNPPVVLPDMPGPAPTPQAHLFCKNRSLTKFIPLVDGGSECEAPIGQFCYIGTAEAASNMIDGFDLHDFYTIRPVGIIDGIVSLDLVHSEGDPDNMTMIKCPSDVRPPVVDNPPDPQPPTANVELFCKKSNGRYTKLLDQGPGCEISSRGRFCWKGNINDAYRALDGVDIHDFYTIRPTRKVGDKILLDLTNSEGPAVKMNAIRCR